MNPPWVEAKLRTDGVPSRRRACGWSGCDLVVEDPSCGKCEPCPDEEISAIERQVTLRQRSVPRVIRSGTVDDAKGVASVQVKTWQTAYAHALPAEQLQAMSVEEHEPRHRTWPPTFVAERGEKIVGYVAVGPSRDEGSDGELYAIYVHPDHWGEGIGQALIRAGEERLRELGHKQAVLWVLEDNPRTRRFYELAGWSADGAAREIELFGFRIPEVRYVKDL